jgi:carbamoyltransferase
MITWGISANSHDAALAVFETKRKGLSPNKSLELKFASHSERFSGIKNDAHLNKELIDYARRWGEPNEVIWYERPFRKTLRQLRAGQGWNYNENNIKRYLKSYGITAPIKYTGHHHSHAAAGYYTSPFRDATVVCIDSIGEFETLTVWKGKGDKLKKIYSQGYPHSVGLWYSAMTQRIGLKPQEDEYILMGMAAYGDPDRLYHDIKSDFVEVGDRTLVKFKQNLHRGCRDWRPDLTTEQDMFDIAAGTQAVYEDILRWVLGKAARMLPTKNLVLMGGCALNCSANHIAHDYFDDVWIMPNPGDAGSAIGAVLARYNKPITLDNAYLGYNIEGDYPVEETISELKKTGIVGVANGRAEFGPRAFGNRSLLADPRGINIKSRVNDIKQRQQFRPFAPVVLAEHYDANFEGHANSYMQFTSRCKHPNLYPAIAHVDNTSRVQIVKADGSGIRRLLERWFETTGCPMLLNTSLNIKGKPMVNDLTDAQEFAIMYDIKVFTKAKNDN